MLENFAIVVMILGIFAIPAMALKTLLHDESKQRKSA